jgi:thymidylate synthase
MKSSGRHENDSKKIVEDVSSRNDDKSWRLSRKNKKTQWARWGEVNGIKLTQDTFHVQIMIRRKKQWRKKEKSMENKIDNIEKKISVIKEREDNKRQ